MLIKYNCKNTDKNKKFSYRFNKSETIAIVKFANDYISRLKGLMFKKDLNYVLVLKPSTSSHRFFSSVHTLFMKFSIDIIFLDEKKKVFEIITISPWKFHTPKKPSHYILEIKKGLIEKYEIAIGDKLDFICKNK